jgi:dephospho-CoA kinase
MNPQRLFEDFDIVGLTGGIASGKSTVGDILRELGVRVIDADVVAREVVEPGTEALDEIRDTFGASVIGDDGGLDREALGDIVFGDEEARAKLEAITHPRIRHRMWALADEARRAGDRWAVYEAALIVENGMHPWLDAIIVVTAPRSVQRARIEARDGLSTEQADARIDAQMPLDEKVAVADFVIDNGGSLEATRRRVREIYDAIERSLDRYDSVLPAEAAEAPSPTDSDTSEE